MVFLRLLSSTSVFSVTVTSDAICESLYRSRGKSSPDVNERPPIAAAETLVEHGVVDLLVEGAVVEVRWSMAVRWVKEEEAVSCVSDAMNPATSRTIVLMQVLATSPMGGEDSVVAEAEAEVTAAEGGAEVVEAATKLSVSSVINLDTTRMHVQLIRVEHSIIRHAKTISIFSDIC